MPTGKFSHKKRVSRPVFLFGASVHGRDKGPVVQPLKATDVSVVELMNTLLRLFWIGVI